MKHAPLYHHFLQMRTKYILMLAVFVFLLKIATIYSCYIILSYPAIMHNIVVTGACIDRQLNNDIVLFIPYDNYVSASPSIPLIVNDKLHIIWNNNGVHQGTGIIKQFSEQGIIIVIPQYDSDLTNISPEMPVQLRYRYQKRNIIQRSMHKILGGNAR